MWLSPRAINFGCGLGGRFLPHWPIWQRYQKQPDRRRHLTPFNWLWDWIRDTVKRRRLLPLAEVCDVHFNDPSGSALCYYQEKKTNKKCMTLFSWLFTINKFFIHCVLRKNVRNMKPLKCTLKFWLEKLPFDIDASSSCHYDLRPVCLIPYFHESTNSLHLKAKLSPKRGRCSFSQLYRLKWEILPATHFFCFIW